MNKKQTYSTIFSGIAISAILVVSSLIAGNQFAQQAFAQPRATAPPAAPPTRATPPPSASATQKPSPSTSPAQARLGTTETLQGTVASHLSPLAGRTSDQVAIILPARKDNGVYSGILTYTASRSVQVQVWNQLSGGVSPSTPIPRQYGSIAISPSPTGKGFVATSLVGPSGSSGSVPFSGNAVALRASSPFIATYSVTAAANMGRVLNNLTSATSAAGLLGGAAGPSALGGSSSSSVLGGAAAGPSGGSEAAGPSGGSSSDLTSGGPAGIGGSSDTGSSDTGSSDTGSSDTGSSDTGR